MNDEIQRLNLPQRRACVGCYVTGVLEWHAAEVVEGCMATNCTSRGTVVVAVRHEDNGMDVSTMCDEHYQKWIDAVENGSDHADSCPRSAEAPKL